MAVSIKALADGQLAGTKGTLYTVPSSTQAVVRVTVVNTDASVRTINLYANKTGTSRRICPKDLSLQPGAEYTTKVQTLEAADIIEGDASVAAVVDFTINGFEVA